MNRWPSSSTGSSVTSFPPILNRKQTRSHHRERAAQDVWDEDFFWLRIFFKFRDDPCLWIDRVPVKVLEASAGLTVIVTKPDRVFIAPFDQEERLAADGNKLRLAVLIES